MGLHSRSNGTLWKVLCFRSTGFHQNTRRQMHPSKNKRKKNLHVHVMCATLQYLQNLFCSLTWCLQTLSPPLGSGNEVLLHLPLPVGQILWWKHYTDQPFTWVTVQIIIQSHTNCCHCALIISIRQSIVIKCWVAHPVDGWQTWWPRSWGFWRSVLTSSERTAGGVCCISVLLWGSPHSLARST